MFNPISFVSTTVQNLNKKKHETEAAIKEKLIHKASTAIEDQISKILQEKFSGEDGKELNINIAVTIDFK